MREIIQPPIPTNYMTPVDIKMAYDIKYNYIVYLVSSHQEPDNNPGTGVAILTHLNDGCWGFMYHRHLIHHISDSCAKYVGSSIRTAVESVLKADKTVLFLTNYSELLELCAKYPKH